MSFKINNNYEYISNFFISGISLRDRIFYIKYLGFNILIVL